MKRILNFGSLNIDKVLTVDHFVRPGETLAASKVDTFPGGKGLNQSVALKKSGADVYHAGKIGGDGLWLAKLLSSFAVNTDFIKSNGSATGTAFIQVDKSGQNCILLYHGANYELTDEQIERTLSYFGKGDMLVLQNEVNSISKLLAAAKLQGMDIALNPSPIDDTLLQLDLSGVTYLILNEIEGKALTGCDDYIKIADKLLSLYPSAKVVLTLGSNGAYYRDCKHEHYHGIYDVPVCDTTAAGDTFTGYFLGLTASGHEASQALRLASVASSIAVSRKGAAVSIPSLDEVLGAKLPYLG